MLRCSDVLLSSVLRIVGVLVRLESGSSVYPLDKVAIVGVQAAIRNRRLDVLALIYADHRAISRDRYFHLVIDVRSRARLIRRGRSLARSTTAVPARTPGGAKGEGSLVIDAIMHYLRT